MEWKDLKGWKKTAVFGSLGAVVLVIILMVLTSVLLFAFWYWDSGGFPYNKGTVIETLPSELEPINTKDLNTENFEDFENFIHVSWWPLGGTMAVYETKSGHYNIATLEGDVIYSLNHSPRYWSNDGNKIALTDKEYSQWTLQIVDLQNNKTSEKQIINTSREMDVAWSPNDTKIAYYINYLTKTDRGYARKYSDIWIQNPDGTDIERMTENAGIPPYGWLYIEWLSEQEVAYMTENELCKVNTKTKEINCLMKTRRRGDSIHAAPDGSKLFYILDTPECNDWCSPRHRKHTAYTMDIDGNNKKKITNELSTFVGWTNDGSSLVYKDYDENFRIYTVEKD
jgi:Tol biopolymer transport system component